MASTKKTQKSIEAEEKFRKKVAEKGGTVKGDYVKSRIKVEIICEKGHLFEATPQHVTHDDLWCTECSSKKTQEIFDILILVVNGKNGKIIEMNSKKSSDKIKLECARGHQWVTYAKVICDTTCWCPDCDKIDGITLEHNLLSTIALREGSLEGGFCGRKSDVVIIKCSEGHFSNKKAGDILRGTWCSECNNKKPGETEKRVKELIESKGGKLDSDFKTTNDKITIICISGHKWTTTCNNILYHETWCPECPKSKTIEAERKFREKVASKGGKIKDGETYQGIHSHITIICAENHEFTVEPNSIMSMDSWCSWCSNNSPKQAAENFYNYIKSMRGTICDEGKYTHAYGDVIIECEFKHRWKICPHFMMAHSSWCPSCNESSGERNVRFVLEKYNVNFTTQKRIPQLPTYKYDFHFIHDNKEYFVEYDGEQHFRKVDFFHKTEDDFKKRLIIDITKTRTIYNLGHYMIRLDYSLTTVDQIEKHIIAAITSGKQIYFSNPELYKIFIYKPITHIKVIKPE